jgi:uncharacterized membrane protein
MNNLGIYCINISGSCEEFPFTSAIIGTFFKNWLLILLITIFIIIFLILKRKNKEQEQEK